MGSASPASAPPPGLSRALIALALAGFVFGLACLGLVLDSSHEEDRGLVAAVDLLVGWSFVGTGLFAWWRRPSSRTGALMTAVGFAWFAQTLSAADGRRGSRRARGVRLPHRRTRSAAATLWAPELDESRQPQVRHG
jgi:hypothetical protein